MSSIQFGGGPEPARCQRELPTASDGRDMYIQKLMVFGGLKPPSWNEDTFERQCPPKKSLSEQIMKWGGIAFAGALAVLGLKNFGMSGVKKLFSGKKAS